jgi:hypothetical protein
MRRNVQTLKLKRNPVVDDLRVIDMYEAAIRHDVQFADRKGNWVQKFVSPDDAQLYATAQFYRYQEVERFLEEHLNDPACRWSAYCPGEEAMIPELIRKQIRQGEGIGTEFKVDAPQPGVHRQDRVRISEHLGWHRILRRG